MKGFAGLASDIAQGVFNIGIFRHFAFSPEFDAPAGTASVRPGMRPDWRHPASNALASRRPSAGLRPGSSPGNL
jgi:hypothetical protein